MPFRSYVIGDESLTIQCAEILLSHGNAIGGIVTSDEEVIKWAQAHRVRVILAPDRYTARGLREHIASDPEPFDWLFSIANLRLIPKEVLSLPRLGTINFHDGPLPEYAGLNTPSWAILRGEKRYGITWHLIDAQKGVDEGDILESESFEIGENDPVVVVNTRCWEAGITAFARLVPKLMDNSYQRIPQDLSRRHYFGRLDRPEAGSTIDWTEPGERILALLRALDFGPRYPNLLGIPKSFIDQAEPSGQVVLLPEAHLGSKECSEAPGSVISVERDGTIEVATGQGTLRFSKVLCREGTPLSQNELFALGIRPGVRLPSPSALAKKALSDLDRQLAKHEIFWSKRLPELLPLELGLERSPGSSPKPIRIPLRLSTSLTPSDFVALACAWAARVTGQLRFDIAYRFPRLASLFRQAPHLLSEFAPLRVELDESLSFSDFRQKIEKERAQIEERAPYRRDLYPRIPHAIRPRWEFGVAIVDEELPSPSSPIPLLFTFLSSSNEAFICFDSSLFSLTSIEEHAERFLVLVDAALKAQGTPVIHLPILSEGEKKKLLDNQSLKPISPRCIHEIIEASVDQHPQKTAVVFENQTITYRELDEASNQLAHFISQRSLEPDDRVAIFLPRSIEMVIGVLATWKAGAAYLPVDPSYPEERIVFYLEDSEAKLILTIEALLERLRPEWREKAICLDRERSAIMEMPKGRPSPKAKPSHLAYLIYTSGSTGTPKGVMVEHRQVANFFEGIDAVIPHDPPGTWLAVTSLSFDISVLELFYTLARGFTVVIAGELEKSFTSHSPIRHRRIGFSLFYFASDDDEKRGAEKYRLLFEGARFADKRGFEAIWTPERHFGAFGGLYPNPSVISAAIAAITERIHIRAGSCVLPLHHPIRVVEEWALVDNISGGRVGISFASGWHPIDFVLRPENHANAKQIMLRDIETVRRLWRGEGVEFEGPTGKVSIRTRPRPVQKELPIWITAAGNPETFVAAAKAKAGVLTHLLGQSFEEVKEKIALYRRTWKECGHEGEGHVTLMLHTFVGEDDEKVREIVREPMKNYLRSSINLIAEHAWSFPAFKRHAKEGVRFEDNFASLSPEDAEALLDHAFERYYETAGLFGSQKRALEIVERCKAIGVDEIACLIDFGVDTDTVLKHLEFLDALRKRAEPRPNLDENDYSIPAQIERWGVTHLQCTPSMARMLLEDEATRLALGRISHLFIGGEALPGALVSRLKEVTSATITNMYGPTETTIWSSTAPAKAVEGTVGIGVPLLNQTMYVLDPHGELVPFGTPGELFIGGLGVARGYLKRPELTKERFLPNPFANAPAWDGEVPRMYRTGDRVRRLRDGSLEFLGRVDHQVKVRGYRIELGEIEARILAFPGIREAVAMAREDQAGDQRLVAYYTVQAGQSVSSRELEAWLRRSLPDFMVPSHFVELVKFPLTPNGKIDRKALPPPDPKSHKEGFGTEQPSSELERAIAEVWKRLLGLSRVGIHDNFFELGGHSLLAVQAHREIKAIAQKPFSVTDVFRFPTIASLARYLGDSNGSSESSRNLQASAERAQARRQAIEQRAQLRRR